MTLSTRVVLLKLFAVLYLIGPGVLMVLSESLPLMPLVSGFIDIAYLPFDGAQRVEGDATTLLNAILGGVLIGFGTLIFGVAGQVYAKDDALGRALLLWAIIGWGVSDSYASIATGAPFNAVLNLFFASCFLATLSWPRRAA
ncbi:MAG: excinuclease ABC subunit A [Pseudomonadota bacterium]